LANGDRNRRYSTSSHWQLSTSLLLVIVRRTIRATLGAAVPRVDSARGAAALVGAHGVTCIGATVDLRIGGCYRIGNRFAERRSHLDQASSRSSNGVPAGIQWRLESPGAAPERVTVTFKARGVHTEVVVSPPAHRGCGDAGAAQAGLARLPRGAGYLESGEA